LSKFGTAFMNRLECAQMESKLLKKLTIIDTPGVLAGAKQETNRNYEFTKVGRCLRACVWVYTGGWCECHRRVGRCVALRVRACVVSTGGLCGCHSCHTAVGVGCLQVGDCEARQAGRPR
jgi:hypothetical protein